MKLIQAKWLICIFTAVLPSAYADEAEIRATLAQRMPGDAKIKEVRKTPKADISI
jgi:hypothetical protein